MADAILLTIDQETLSLVPGETVQATVTIQNASNVVDVFSIEVQGLDASWYQLSLSTASLFPGDQTTSTLTVNPPRDSASVAGTYPLTLRATSRKDPNQETTLSATLEVRAYHGFEAQPLRPGKVTGARGLYTLSLTNTGNADLALGLEGKEREGLCDFAFDPQVPQLPPGESVEVKVRVEPRQRPLSGRSKSYNFSITATPVGGAAEPKTVNGELEATPRLPRWAIPVAGASVVALVLLIVLIIIFSGGGGVVYTGPFDLEPGEDVTYGFSLPEASQTRIRATAQWEESGSLMDLTLLSPDGTPQESLRVSGSNPSVTFLTSGAEVDGWAINVRNELEGDSAVGTLTLTFSSQE